MKYEDILTFANNASVPCVNLLCDQNHPTQAICDLLTILVHFRRIKGIKIAFIGACNNNVARSLIEGILMCGGSYVGIGPKAAHPTQEELSFYQSLASQYGGTVKFSTDLIEVQGVDVIYQDVFLDLGEQFNL
jgi:ornithine carbamoyltransferase